MPAAADDPGLQDLFPRRAIPRPGWQKLLLVAGSVLSFAAGVVGWLLPVVTGIPFYVLGIVLLAAASDVAREGLNRWDRRRSPRTRRTVRRIISKLRFRHRRPRAGEDSTPR